MSLKITMEGAAKMLDCFFGKAPKPSGTWTLQLFTFPNALNPGEFQDALQTGFEWFGGMSYAPKTLDPMTTSDADIINGGVAFITWPDQLFTFSGAATADTLPIQGYAVLLDETVVFEELLDAPYLPANDGDHLSVKLAYLHGNGTPTVNG